MSDASQPRKARGKVLPVGIIASALIALLAFAPLASATVDPVGGGSTTLTLQKKYTEYLKTFGIKIKPIKPAKLKGANATFKVTGGTIDPTTGKGELTHSGGLKITAGKKSASLKALVVNTTKKEITAKVGKKRIGVFKLAGIKLTRSGFNANVAAKKVKLTPKAATALNEALGFAGGKPLPFLKNKNVGKSKATAEPSTLGVLPGGSLTYAPNATTLSNLLDVGVKIAPVGATLPTVGGGFVMPIASGTLSPLGTSGLLETAAGLQLTQVLKFPPAAGVPDIETTITLANFHLDLAGKTVLPEVIAVSNAVNSKGEKPLNLGNLGRSSIADTTLVGATADPSTKTITVTSSAALQEVSAKVLNGFVEVYEGYKAALKQPETKAKLAPGENLGTFTAISTTE